MLVLMYFTLVASSHKYRLLLPPATMISFILSIRRMRRGPFPRPLMLPTRKDWVSRCP